MTLLQVKNLVKHFPVRGGFLNRVVGKVQAVNNVSFGVEAGETLGVVGESGCGKSTLGKTIMRLYPPTAGQVEFDGTDISNLGRTAMLPIRRKMQMIFQDPNSSLNPRMTIAGTLGEVTRFHRVVPHSDVDAYVDELMNKVGMRPDDKTKYPHEFSGGQKQRIGIARALAVQPQFIVADEPVSALDVSIQAQVLNLMQDLKDEFQLTLMFISHDLKVVNHFCDRLIVMYLGHVVEELRCNNLAQDAKHPYTQALLGANPINDPDERRPLTVLEGDVPSPYNPPPGCPFAGRCSMVTARCRVENPPLVQIGTDHEVACWEVAPPTEQTPVTQDAAS